MSIEQLLADLSPDAATLARSVLGRLRALGTIAEREGKGEVTFTAGGVEIARLSLRAGAMPKVAFAPQSGGLPAEPIEITGLPAAAAAAEAIRQAAAAHAARAPQLDLFGVRR